MESWHLSRYINMVLLEANTELCTSIAAPAKDFVVLRDDEHMIATARNLVYSVRHVDLLEKHRVVRALHVCIVVLCRHLAIASITDVENLSLICQNHRTERHASYLLDLSRECNLRIGVLDCYSSPIIRG